MTIIWILICHCLVLFQKRIKHTYYIHLYSGIFLFYYLNIKIPFNSIIIIINKVWFLLELILYSKYIQMYPNNSTKNIISQFWNMDFIAFFSDSKIMYKLYVYVLVSAPEPTIDCSHLPWSVKPIFDIRPAAKYR